MPNVELVYFEGCPNVELAREAIRRAGLKFREIEHGSLSVGSPYLAYSSPTILFDGEIVAGSKNGAAACSMISWQEVETRLLVLANKRKPAALR